MKAHIKNDEPSLSLSGNGVILCGGSLFCKTADPKPPKLTPELANAIKADKNHEHHFRP